MYRKTAKSLLIRILKISKNKLILLLFINLIVYNKWLNFQPLLNGDWRFYFSSSLASGITPSIWSSSKIAFGDLSVALWRYPLDVFNALFGIFGYSSNISDKFLVLWPIIFLAPIGSFFLVKKITKSDISGFIGALIFSFNTYFLSINTQGHLLLTLAFSVGVFAILSFINLLDAGRKIFIPITAVLLFIVGFIDLRSLYVVTGIIILYAVYNQLVIEKSWNNSKANLANSFLVFFILILLNLYWIFPFLTANTLTSNEILARPILEGNFYSIQNVIALFYPFWTETEPTWFFVQKIPIYFWLLPILAFFGFAIGRKNKQIIFFALLALIGVFLTKQDSAPFGQIYNFFYNNIPGFSAFREASKFYFLIILSYSVLTGYFVFWLFNNLKNKTIKYIVILLIVLLPLLNTIPMVSGSIGTMFIPRAMPKDVQKIDKFLFDQKEHTGVFWINLDLFWLASSNNHPLIWGSVSTLREWEKITDGSFDPTIDLTSSNIQAEKIMTFLVSEEGKRLLSQGSYGYVIVNLKNNDWTDIGIDQRSWSKLANKLKDLEYLEQINIGTDNVLVFRNLNVRPRVYATQEKESLERDVPYNTVEFSVLNPSHYEIYINSKNSFYINFTERYHPDWRLYTGEFSLLDVVFNKQEGVNEEEHLKNIAGFNAFFVNPQSDCFSDQCKLTLFFRPQAYLYLGLVVTAITLLLTVVSMVYFYRKRI